MDHVDGSMLFALRVTRVQDSVVVYLVGELDAFAVEALQGALSGAVLVGVDDLTFDFSDLFFVNLAGLRCLDETVRSALDTGRQVRIVGMGGLARRVVGLADFRALAEVLGQPGGRPAYEPVPT